MSFEGKIPSSFGQLVKLLFIQLQEKISKPQYKKKRKSLTQNHQPQPSNCTSRLSPRHQVDQLQRADCAVRFCWWLVNPLVFFVDKIQQVSSSFIYSPLILRVEYPFMVCLILRVVEFFKQLELILI